MNGNLFLILAASATVAYPDLEAEGLCSPTGDDEDFAWTGVLDYELSRWVVLASLSDTGKESLEKQEKIPAMLTNYHDAHRITFEAPRPVGRTNGHIPHGDAGGVVPPEVTSLQAIVYRMLPGDPLESGGIDANSDMAHSLGRAIAMLHEVPVNIMPYSGLPSFTVAETRDGLREKLSTAVSTGLIPPTLQVRWEQALDEDAWWRFHPTFVHGSLKVQTVLVADSRVLGISDFSEVCVDDPAKDLAWLLTELSKQTVDSIFDVYHLGCVEGIDSFLRQRSELHNELALVDWLNWGVSQENSVIIADVQELMEEQLERLDGDLSLTGKPLLDVDTDTIELDGIKDAPTTNPSETETPQLRSHHV